MPRVSAALSFRAARTLRPPRPPLPALLRPFSKTSPHSLLFGRQLPVPLQSQSLMSLIHEILLLYLHASSRNHLCDLTSE